MTRKDRNFYIACGIVFATIALTNFVINLFTK